MNGINDVLTTKELRLLEKKASKIWYKFTDNGTNIHPAWLMEYEKLRDTYLRERKFINE